MVEYVEVSPEFGSAMPHGSCNAIFEFGPYEGMLCGFPRREDGSCIKGHPPEPKEKEGE